MKQNIYLLLIILLFLNISLNAQELKIESKSNGFIKNSFMITPYVAYFSWATSFGGCIEYAINERFTIGGDVLLAFWSEDYLKSKLSKSTIIPTVFTTYHFTAVNVKNLDVYIGIKGGYSIYSESISDPTLHEEWEKTNAINKNGIFFCPLAGVRYYISKKIALFLMGNLSAVGDWNGAGILGGITFRVN